MTRGGDRLKEDTSDWSYRKRHCVLRGEVRALAQQFLAQIPLMTRDRCASLIGCAPGASRLRVARPLPGLGRQRVDALRGVCAVVAGSCSTSKRRSCVARFETTCGLAAAHRSSWEGSTKSMDSFCTAAPAGTATMDLSGLPLASRGAFKASRLSRLSSPRTAISTSRCTDGKRSSTLVGERGQRRARLRRIAVEHLVVGRQPLSGLHHA